MNKKGNIFWGVTIAIFLWVSGVLIMPFVIDDIGTFRTLMQCSSSTITSGTILSCLMVDSFLPYFIWFFASIAIGYIAGANQ